jgi:hypothetical protein
LLLLSVLSLASCTPLDFAKNLLGGGSGPSLELDATLGDKHEEVQVGDKVTADTVQITNELDYVLLVVAILGWVMPTPGQLWSKGTSWITRLRRG